MLEFYLILVLCMFDVVGRFFFFFKQKTAYEMRISDWSSDVCSSDLEGLAPAENQERGVFMVFTLPQPVAGRQLAGRVTLRSSVSQRVVVKFARQGQGAFVADASEVELPAGEPSSLNLSLDCRDGYPHVPLFVAPLPATPAPFP